MLRDDGEERIDRFDGSREEGVRVEKRVEEGVDALIV